MFYETHPRLAALPDAAMHIRHDYFLLHFHKIFNTPDDFSQRIWTDSNVDDTAINQDEIGLRVHNKVSLRSIVRPICNTRRNRKRNLVSQLGNPFAVMCTQLASSPRSFRQCRRTLSVCRVTHVLCFARLIWVFRVTLPEEKRIWRWREGRVQTASWQGRVIGTASPRDDVYEEGSHSRRSHGAARRRLAARRVGVTALSVVRPRVLAVYFATRFTTITVN